MPLGTDLGNAAQDNTGGYDGSTPAPQPNFIPRAPFGFAQPYPMFGDLGQTTGHWFGQQFGSPGVMIASGESMPTPAPDAPWGVAPFLEPFIYPQTPPLAPPLPPIFNPHEQFDTGGWQQYLLPPYNPEQWYGNQNPGFEPGQRPGLVPPTWSSRTEPRAF